jgi:hypothetical protein
MNNNQVLGFYKKDPGGRARERSGPSSPPLERQDLEHRPLTTTPGTTPLGPPPGWNAVSRSEILRIDIKAWRKRELLGAGTPKVR